MDVKIDGKKVAEVKPEAVALWEKEVEFSKLKLKEYEFMVVKEKLWIKAAEKQLELEIKKHSKELF